MIIISFGQIPLITGQWSLVFDFNGLAKEDEVILKKYDKYSQQDCSYSQGRRQPVIFNISLSETYIVFSSSFKSLINWWCITIQGKTYKWLFEGKVTFVLPGPAEWWFHPSWISEHLRSTLTGVAFSHCHWMRYLSQCLTFPQVHWWSDVIFGKTFTRLMLFKIFFTKWMH